MPLTPSPPEAALPFVDHLLRESGRFRAVLTDVPPGVRVPTCPDWTADDLLWHLTGVQWFWGEIAQRRVTRSGDIPDIQAARPTRPDGRAALLGLFDAASERLAQVLSHTPPETELWMWADDHSAAYISRRQAHEALIHRIDAELTAGTGRAPIDCRLAADGVDEALRVMRGHEPKLGLSAVPTGPAVTIALVDGFHTWSVTPVHVTGTDADGDDWDVRRFLVADGPAEGSAEVCGVAGDVDCWLWNRPTVGQITRQGDPAALAEVDAVVGAAVG